MDVDGVLRQRGSGPLVGPDTYVSSEFCWQEPSSSSPAGRNLPPMVLWLPGARGARPSHARKLKLQTRSQGVRAVARRLNPSSQGKVLSKLKMAPLVRSAGKWSFWYRRALTCSWIGKGSSAVVKQISDLTRVWNFQKTDLYGRVRTQRGVHTRSTGVFRILWDRTVSFGWNV